MEIASSGTNSRRWIGLVISVVVLLFVLFYVYSQLKATNFDFGFIPAHFFESTLIEGAKMTLFLSVVAQIFGVLLGLAAALMRLSKNPLLNAIAGFYIWLFRGTPLLVQLIVFATGLYQIGIKLDLLPAALLALSINEGAYMSEIIRAGIQSIDPGQMEAARSLGMTYSTGMRRIVLPQAARVILPPTGNEFNNMLKSSSLASVISVGELLQHAGDLNHQYFKTLETFVIVSCYYLFFTTLATWGQSWLERRLGDRKQQGEAPTGFFTRLRTNLSSGRSALDHR